MDKKHNQGIAGDHLRSFIERIENLTEEKKLLQEDIKEVFSEAKGTGFDVKIMRQIVRLRAMESGDRIEQEYMLEMYKGALGMQSDLFDKSGELSGPAEDPVAEWGKGLVNPQTGEWEDLTHPDKV